jgi:putative oxidoreductase
MIRLINKLQDVLDALRALDFLAPLALRLYLAPVFWVAGVEKFTGFNGIVEWFGDQEWGLGLPAPAVLALLATATEVVGALCLLIGFAVRWISLPLMATMVVAAVTVHWENGWQAIASAKAPFAAESLGPFKLEDVGGHYESLSAAKDVLTQCAWQSDAGKLVVLNNGIEFAATYFVMLLALFFMGGGRFLSADYWIARRWRMHA